MSHSYITNISRFVDEYLLSTSSSLYRAESHYAVKQHILTACQVRRAQVLVVPEARAAGLRRTLSAPGWSRTPHARSKRLVACRSSTTYL